MSTQGLTPTQAVADYYTSQLSNGGALAQSLLSGTAPEFQALYNYNSRFENSTVSSIPATGSSPSATSSASRTAAQQQQTSLVNNANVLAQSLGLGNYVDVYA